MRNRLTVTLLVVSGVAGMSAPADIAEVKSLELRLWEAWRTGDTTSWAQLTAPDYEWTDGRNSRGYAEVRQTFDLGRLDEYQTGEMHAKEVAPGVIVLSYRASMRGVYRKQAFQGDVAECSLWVKRKGKWQNVLLEEVQTTPEPTKLTPPQK